MPLTLFQLRVLLLFTHSRDSSVTGIDLNHLNASLNQVKRALFVLLALGMVLFARADEKPPRLSVGALPAAQTLVAHWEE